MEIILFTNFKYLYTIILQYDIYIYILSSIFRLASHRVTKIFLRNSSNVENFEVWLIHQLETFNCSNDIIPFTIPRNCLSIDSIGSLRRSLSALKVTIQIGKVGESIWQYSQFVSRRAQCYQAYIYIHTIQIQGSFGLATSGLPISLSIEFSSNVPHCSEEISDRKLVSYSVPVVNRTLLPPTPPIYKENGGLTFHS